MTLESCTAAGDHLVVGWTDGATSRFHYVWLRDNCGCPDCRHPTVGERLLISLDVPLDLVASSAVVVDGTLVVDWPDGHRSRFPADWLATHDYEPTRRDVPPPAEPWSDELRATPPSVDFAAVMADDGAVADWLRRLRTHGVCFVRGAPLVEGTVGALAERIAFIRNSNFGPVWDVRSKPDANSLAYTAHRLTPHIDLVSRESLPGLQFLHCLVFEATGGDSVLVDGFACAAELARQDPAAFTRLTTIPLRFRYRDRDTEISARAPMIRLDEHGRPAEIRYSNALLAPLEVEPEQTTAMYAAMHAFGRLLLDERFTIRTRLRPGDVMCFDNYRVLHAREAFDPQSGPRHLQGTYLDRDDWLSRLAVLERT